MCDYVKFVIILFVCLLVVYRIGYRDGAAKMLDVLTENPKLLEMCSEIVEHRENIFPELKEAREKLKKEENNEGGRE